MSDAETRAKEIFFEALEQSSPAAITAHIAKACGDDVQLRDRVEQLLRAHQDAGNFLGGSGTAPTVDQPVEGGTDPTVDPPVAELPGMQIGPFKLLQVIGEGGMGVVYMADQTEPVRRRVALKIIKPGMDSKQVIARFEAERQALAMMEHPNIAHVLDAGTTDSGRPYFVMELVKGVPITEYCDKHRLSPKERLDLMVPICQAVQHAHQKGIIHRDLKPTNILIAQYDDKPVPKIIDFGVAKAVSQQLTEKTLFTQYGQIVGTIEYMSPEQATFNQFDVDTRTDIYSLGVLLYELLVGERPFDGERLRKAAFDELLRIIREEEPPPPSVRLSSSTHMPTIAANRQTEAKKLSLLMRGELDWIVMKALEKDRSRRYETANGLARDIGRYLKDEPVAACPPSLGYRFSKFARRNKAALAVSGMVLVTLLLGLITTTWQAVRATKAETEARRSESRAIVAKNTAIDEKEKARLAEGRAKAGEEKAKKEEQRAKAAETEAHNTVAALSNYLYAADLRAAQTALEEGDVEQAKSLLNKYVPKQGEPDRRCFAWRHLMHQTRYAKGVVANGGQCLTVSRDGKLMLWSTGGKLVVGDAQSRSVQWQADAPRHCLDAAIVPGNQQLIVACASGTREQSYNFEGIYLFEFGTTKRETIGDSTVNGRCVAVSPDGKLLACAAKGHKIQLWNLTGRELLAEIEGHGRDVDALEFINDHRLVSAAYGESVRMWDVSDPGSPRSFKILSQFSARAAIRDTLFARSHWRCFPAALAVGPHGQVIAAAANGSSIVLYRADGRMLASIDVHTDAVSALAFTPDGDRLVSASLDRTVRISNIATKSEVAQLGSHADIVNNLVLVDGRRVLTQGDDTTIREWIVPHENEPVEVITSKSTTSGFIYSLALSPDNKRVASGGWLYSIPIIDLNSGSQLETFQGAKGRVHRMEFSPDGTLLACANQDEKSLDIWVAETGERLRVDGTRIGGAYSTSFSKDGKRIAFSRYSTGVIDAATQDWLTVIPGSHARFSPGGKWLAVQRNGEIVVHDAESYRPVAAVPSNARDFALSYDDRLLAFESAHARGEHEVIVWEIENRRIVHKMSGHLAEINDLSFCPDGKTLASASKDGRVILWDLATGQRKVVLRGHNAAVESLRFSIDGHLLATGGLDRQIRIWRSATGGQRVGNTEVARTSAEQFNSTIGSGERETETGRTLESPPPPPISPTDEVFTKILEDYRQRGELPEGELEERAIGEWLVSSGISVEAGGTWSRTIDDYRTNAGPVTGVSTNRDDVITTAIAARIAQLPHLKRVESPSSLSLLRALADPSSSASVEEVTVNGGMFNSLSVTSLQNIASLKKTVIRNATPTPQSLTALAELKTLHTLEVPAGPELHRQVLALGKLKQCRTLVLVGPFTAALEQVLRNQLTDTKVVVDRLEHERDVAKWVLSVGGKVEVEPLSTSTSGDTERASVMNSAMLPTIPFFVVGIELKGVPLTDNDMARFTPLRQIERLVIGSCRITDAGVRHLTGLTELTSLGLWDTDIQGDGLRYLSGLTKIWQLNLDACKLTNSGFENLPSFPNLRQLKIARNTALTDSSLRVCTRLPSLEYLRCFDTGIHGEGLIHLQNSSALQTIEMGGRQLRPIALKHLKILDGLKTLELTNCRQFSLSDIQHLSSLQTLSLLRLGDTYLAVQDINVIQESLPECTIEWTALKSEAEHTKAIEKDPESPDGWVARGEFHLQHQRWSKAAADFEECFRLGFADDSYRAMAAVAHLMAGNREAYIEYCDYLSKQSANQEKGNFAIKVCSLIPLTSVDYPMLLDVARDYAKEQPDKWWMAIRPGAVLYRLGRYSEALEVFKRTQGLAVQRNWRSIHDLWLAMTYHQLGETELAKKTLSEAKEISRSWLPGPKEWLGIGGKVFNFVECQVIEKEAEHLIGKVEPDSSQLESANESKDD